MMQLRSQDENAGKSIGNKNVAGKKNQKRRSNETSKRMTRSKTNTRGVFLDITNSHNQQAAFKRSKQETVKPSNQGAFGQTCRPVALPDPPTNSGSDNLLAQKPCSDPESVLDGISDDVPMNDESDCDDEKQQEIAIYEKEQEIDILRIDAADIHNPQAVSEYIQDIMIYFRDVEGKRAPNARYMDSQKDINKKMREILIDWLWQVHLKFKLRSETMYLAVNLIDRFLSIQEDIPRNQLQLVGCTSMLIASKYEEIYAPEVRDFVYISDNAYTRDQFLNMETLILNVLKFNLTVPSILRFGQRFIKLVIGADERFTMLVKYLMELTLQNYRFLNYLPSKIAASATYLALAMVSNPQGKPEWPRLLQVQTNYNEERLRDCVCDLQLLASSKNSTYMAVRKKYSSRKYHEVAKIPVGRPLF